MSKQPGKVSESAILAQIRQYLRLTGWYVIRHQQGLGSHQGLSDLTAVRDGETIYVEVKAPNGRQSEGQVAFQRQIEAHGARYILARSLDDVIAAVGKKGPRIGQQTLGI